MLKYIVLQSLHRITTDNVGCIQWKSTSCESKVLINRIPIKENTTNLSILFLIGTHGGFFRVFRVFFVLFCFIFVLFLFFFHFFENHIIYANFWDRIKTTWLVKTKWLFIWNNIYIWSLKTFSGDRSTSQIQTSRKI